MYERYWGSPEQVIDKHRKLDKHRKVNLSLTLKEKRTSDSDK